MTDGQSVVDTIAQGDTIESVEILRIGADAENFDAQTAFIQFEADKQKRMEAQKVAQAAALAEITEGFTQTESGLFYSIEKKEKVNNHKKETQLKYTIKVNYLMELYLIPHLSETNQLNLVSVLVR